MTYWNEGDAAERPPRSVSSMPAWCVRPTDYYGWRRGRVGRSTTNDRVRGRGQWSIAGDIGFRPTYRSGCCGRSVPVEPCFAYAALLDRVHPDPTAWRHTG